MTDPVCSIHKCHPHDCFREHNPTAFRDPPPTERPADVPEHYVHCVDGACAQPCWHDPTYHDPLASLCGIHQFRTAGCPACQSDA